MKTLGEVLTLSSHYLKERGVERGRFLSENILAHVLGCARMDLYLKWDYPFSEKELAEYRPLLARLGRKEPVEYVIGEVFFFKERFRVDKRALIPRQETEILLDKICKRLAQLDLKGKVLWDVCSGSGCLGLSLKKIFPDLHVVLSDLSEEALDLAKENGARLGACVEYIHGDLLDPFIGQKADFFVCNPPYLSAEEYRAADSSLRDFEPKLALMGGTSGLEIYKRLADDLPQHLFPGALVFFEIGFSQGEAINKIFSSEAWISSCLEKDFAGHDRFFFLEFQSFFQVTCSE